MIEITNSIWDLSAIIIIFSAILLYFGQLIAYTKVAKYERTDLLISGLLFTLIFILFPVIVNIFLYQKGLIINNYSWAIIFIQVFVFVIYARYYSYKGRLLKYDLIEEFNKRFEKKVKKSVSQDKLTGKLLKQKPNISKQSLKHLNYIFNFFGNQGIIISLSILIIYITFMSIQTKDIFLISCNGLLTFINFTLIALAYGLSSAHYPVSKIILTNGKSITGKALKIGEFITLINKDKQYLINKDQVVMIELNKMKRQDEKTTKFKNREIKMKLRQEI